MIRVPTIEIEVEACGFCPFIEGESGYCNAPPPLVAASDRGGREIPADCPLRIVNAVVGLRWVAR